VEIEIEDKKDNRYLRRIEVRYKIGHEGGRTPKRGEVKKLLARELEKSENLIAIEFINTEYGKNVSDGYAKIYDDEESMKIEKEHILKRMKGEKETKAEAVEKVEKAEAKAEAVEKVEEKGE